jgi:hypothetical protein
MLEEAVTTTRYHVGLTLRAIVRPGHDFEAFLDRFYQNLLAMEEREDSRIVDPDMSASLAEHTFDVEMLVDADDPIEVSLIALTSVRTALHTVGCATPGWEVHVEQITSETRAASEQLQDA